MPKLFSFFYRNKIKELQVRTLERKPLGNKEIQLNWEYLGIAKLIILQRDTTPLHDIHKNDKINGYLGQSIVQEYPTLYLSVNTFKPANILWAIEWPEFYATDLTTINWKKEADMHKRFQESENFHVTKPSTTQFSNLFLANLRDKLF